MLKVYAVIVFVCFAVGYLMGSYQPPTQPASSWLPPAFTFSTFEYQPTKVETQVQITWETDPVVVAAKLQQLSERLDANVIGSATIQNGKCTVYAYEPINDMGIHTLGHEFLHCFRGSWHE